MKKYMIRDFLLESTQVNHGLIVGNFNHFLKSLHKQKPGCIVQTVACLTTDTFLTADPGIASSIPARYHTFVEIDREIIQGPSWPRILGRSDFSLQEN